ncbi:MAG: phosphotransferase [Actinomycetales bacterium]
MPSADVTLTADDVTALLQEQHPDLADREVTLVAAGWDNVMARVGDDLVARLPRRAAAAELIRSEQRWLPILAPTLPLPTPAPVRIGVPTERYPYSWSLVPWLPGGPAVLPTGSPAPLDTAGAAEVLGEFLRALHQPAPPDAPANPFRGVPLQQRAERDDRNVVAAAERNEVSHLSRALEAGRAAARYAGPTVWLHGDLHPANLLVDQGRLDAVIDFGDLTAGDPATDLAVAWMLFDAADRELLWSAYTSAPTTGDPGLWQRARGWAAAFAAMLLANSDDNAQLAAIGAATSRRLLSDTTSESPEPDGSTAGQSPTA